MASAQVDMLALSWSVVNLPMTVGKRCKGGSVSWWIGMKRGKTLMLMPAQFSFLNPGGVWQFSLR